MKFVALGFSDFILNCVRAILDSGGDVAALVSLAPPLRPLNSADVASFAQQHGLAY